MLSSLDYVLFISQYIGGMAILLTILKKVKYRYNTRKLKKWMKVTTYIELAMMFVNVLTSVSNKAHGKEYITSVFIAILWGVLAILDDNNTRKL